MEHRRNPGYTRGDENLPVAYPGDFTPLSRNRGGHPHVALVRVRHRHDVRGLSALYRARPDERAGAYFVASMLPSSGRTQPVRPEILPRPELKSRWVADTATESPATAGCGDRPRTGRRPQALRYHGRRDDCP